MEEQKVDSDTRPAKHFDLIGGLFCGGYVEFKGPAPELLHVPIPHLPGWETQYRKHGRYYRFVGSYEIKIIEE